MLERLPLCPLVTNSSTLKKLSYDIYFDAVKIFVYGTQEILLFG